MINTMEVIEKLAVLIELLLNVVEKSLFCTSQDSVVRVCRWGGHTYIFPVSCLFRILFTKKLLKSELFRNSENQNGG